MDSLWTRPDPPVSDHVGSAARQLESVRRLVVLTGAGMSQESGVPTFRDALTGLWARYDPAAFATPEAFLEHPARVFGWYLHRWRAARAAQPHAGHVALAALAEAFDEFLLVTQNVDELHQRAGSRDVIELHGSLMRFRCFAGAHAFDIETAADVIAASDAEVPPPPCRECGSPVRPDVVWFGELLPQDALVRAWHAVERCDALLVVGTSSLVYPAAGLPDLALRNRIPVVAINPEPTSLTERADMWWPERAGTALPALAARMGVGAPP